MTVTKIADLSRAAFVGFMLLAPSKHALGEWLLGPYKLAIAFGPRRVRTNPSATDSYPPAEADVIDILRTTQASLRKLLARARENRRTLVDHIPAQPHIVPIIDRHGLEGFAPIDGIRLRLSDRALALFLADYLTRPEKLYEIIAATVPAPPGRHSEISPRSAPLGTPTIPNFAVVKRRTDRGSHG